MEFEGIGVDDLERIGFRTSLFLGFGVPSFKVLRGFFMLGGSGVLSLIVVSIFFSITPL